MATVVMPNPLDKLKKMRGRTWDELRMRGGQAVSAYGEKIGFREQLPTDDELVGLIDREHFGSGPVIAESLWQHFFRNADECFFPSFKKPTVSAEQFRSKFAVGARHLTAAADAIVAGRIDLLGFGRVFIGQNVQWHSEAVSGKRSPIKHWKEFDELDAEESGDKKIVWELNRHQHFFTLGAAFWLTRDERYAEMFVHHLESWMDQNPPGMGVNWSSSLEVAFRAMSWIWAFQFFRNADSFRPELFRRAVKFLYLHGRHIEKYLSQYYSPNTHLTGEALGLYYLGTQLPFLERSKAWRETGERIMYEQIGRQVLDDGVYFEQSTWYQRYTIDFYTHFAVLKALTDGRPGGAPADELERLLLAALDFMVHVTRPDGTTPLIGDDDGGRMLPLTNAEPNDFRGTLAAAATLMDRGELKSIAGEAREEVFWLFGIEGLQKYDTIEEEEPRDASRGFADGGYYAMRDGWLDTDNYLLVDCGPVGALSGGHGHADALSIEVAIHGKNLFIDPGTYSYSESREVRDHFRSTAAHNTLTIDGRSSSEPGGTFGWKTRAESKTRRWISEERFDHFEGVCRGFGETDQTKHERSVLFLKNDYMIIRDLGRAAGEHEYAVNFQLPVDEQATIGTGGSVAGNGWRMFTFGDNGVWQKRESWVSNCYGNKTNAPLLRYVGWGRGAQEFFTFVLPATAASHPQVEELAVDGGRAFAIQNGGYTDLFVFNDDPQNTIRTELFDSNFRLTWARLAQGADTPEEYVLIGGSDLKVNGCDVIGERNELSFAAIRRVGRVLNLNTQKGRSSISLP